MPAIRVTAKCPVCQQTLVQQNTGNIAPQAVSGLQTAINSQAQTHCHPQTVAGKVL